MDTYRHFETETQPKWAAISTTLTMFASAAAAAVALWFFTKLPGPTLYVLILSLLTCGVMALVISKKPPVRLHFTGSHIAIRDANGQEYYLSNICAKDLVLKQTSLEKKTDVGRLHIKSKGLYFYGVQNFDVLSRYIEENIPG